LCGQGRLTSRHGRNPRRMILRHTLIASVLLFAALVFATVAASAERGMRKSLQEDPPAVDLSTLKTLAAVVEKLAQKKIVYVGEEHDKFSHHRVQLEVLRGLYQQTPKLAVGMEMFQRPFQKALDDYIAGAIRSEERRVGKECRSRWATES